MEIRIKTGVEIVRLHTEYRQKIGELEEQLGKLRTDLQTLEATRFEALEPIVIGVSLLGGK